MRIKAEFHIQIDSDAFAQYEFQRCVRQWSKIQGQVLDWIELMFSTLLCRDLVFRMGKYQEQFFATEFPLDTPNSI